MALQRPLSRFFSFIQHKSRTLSTFCCRVEHEFFKSRSEAYFSATPGRRDRFSVINGENARVRGPGYVGKETWLPFSSGTASSATEYYPKKEVSISLLQELSAIVGGSRVSQNQTLLDQHGRDESYHESVPPRAVVFVESNEEVAEVVKACARHRTPIVPFGAGTSLEGHISALQGGICVDLSRMNDILEVHADDMDCRVQAGVTRQQLNQHLRDTGLFFPVDPGSEATLGGMAATRASGTNAVRYGTMRDNVMGVTAVMGDGSIVRTGRRARKSSSGYDLTALLVGSEGTLGIITEVALRLWGQPEAMASAVCAFNSLDQAVQTVMETMHSGIPVARIELLDDVQVDAVNRYSHMSMAVKPTLFFEFHGSAAAVEEQAQAVGALALANGGGGFQWARAAEDRARLWAARHSAYYAALALRPNARGMPTDVCVPLSHLGDCVMRAKEDIIQSQLTAPIVGHVGDGNFHMLVLVDPSNRDELARVHAFNRRLVEHALSVGGTCSGEHGVGYGKLEFLEAEHGAKALEIMSSIKSALDPLHLMNPGKLGCKWPPPWL